MPITTTISMNVVPMLDKTKILKDWKRSKTVTIPKQLDCFQRKSKEPTDN